MLEVKKYYTEEDMILLDEKIWFIPLTYDKLFKGIFKDKLELLKIFILSQLEFDINPDECKIELFDSEISKLNKNEYQKTIDIYVRIDNIYVNIEINREYFKNVCKRNLIYADRIYSTLLEQSEGLSKLENIIFVQINLNVVDKLNIRREKLKYGTDKLVTYGLNSNETYNDNKIVLIKYFEYYRDLYYNKREKLTKADLWLVLFTSKNFQELYNVSSELLDEETQYEFMRKVINMIGDKRVFEDWEIEYLNRYVEYKKEQNAIKDGIEQDFEQGLEQGRKNGIDEATYNHVKNMLKENLSVELISKITNKTKKEIIAIKDSL